LTKLPTQARIVVIGGGIVGCSVAYHLAKMGLRDVVLVERDKLTSGTTWHAAGLVAGLRSSEPLTTLIKYSGDLYANLETETGIGTGYRRTGGLVLAGSSDRFHELRRLCSTARSLGVEAQILSPSETCEKWPLLSTDDLSGSLWIPGAGQTNPSDTATALARGARQHGATVVEGCAVTEIRSENGSVSGVMTDSGFIRCEIVALCAGMWSRQIAAKCGVNIPLHAAEHFYVVTEPLEGMHANLATVGDPDGHVYFKEDAGSLVVGFFEPNAKPWATGGVPEDFSFGLLEDDWEHVAPYFDHALKRLPDLASVGIRQTFNGPESFTPDNHFILGEAPELRKLFVAAGFNSVGISSAGGAGLALAEWIENGAPTRDLIEVDIRRFGGFQRNRTYLRDRTAESLGLLYAMHWPYRQLSSSRPLRRSAIHDRLAEHRACFGELFGWERPNWFARPRQRKEYRYSYGKQNWFENSAAEHRAVREDVGLFDLSSYSKFLMVGNDSEAALQRICANDVAVSPGKIVYTGVLNERGGFECDLTVTRLAEDTFLIVTGVQTATRDADWIRKHIQQHERASLVDVTSSYCVVSLMGPKAPALLSCVADADLSKEGFPFATAREIDVGKAMALAMRISYVGEEGWELYLKTDVALTAYDAIVQAGAEFGLQHAGFHALNSLRLEKGFRHWGDDITPFDTPLQAGLSFAVAIDKSAPFIGREALLAQKVAGVGRRLVHVKVLDETLQIYGTEPIRRNGIIVGSLTSGAFGHTLGLPVGLGYITCETNADRASIETGLYEVEIAGVPVPVRISLKPFL